MSENVFTLSRDDKTATALVRHERSTSKLRYSQYVADHTVTLDTVPDHVQALANLAGSIRKWETPAERKAFCTKIRNGLKHHLGPVVDDSDDDESNSDSEGSEGSEDEGSENEGTDPMAAVLAAVAVAVTAGLSKADIVTAINGL